MRTFFIALLLTVFTTGLAQTAQQTPQEKLESDIKNNTVTLYILGGFAARVYEGDAEFQEKYRVKYHDFGCLAPVNLNFYKDYNLLVYAYLNVTHGTEWQSRIRPNSIGWENWDGKEK